MIAASPWVSKLAKRKAFPLNETSNPLSIRGENDDLALDSRTFGLAGDRILTTTVEVTTEGSLIDNLKSNTTINLGNDIVLSEVSANLYTGIIINEEQKSLVIIGLGLYKVDGQGTVRCFYVSGGGVSVVIQNFVITKGSGNGGGLYINKARVPLNSCTITMNSGKGSVESVGGGLYITSATVSLVICSIVESRGWAASSGWVFVLRQQRLKWWWPSGKR